MSLCFYISACFLFPADLYFISLFSIFSLIPVHVMSFTQWPQRLIGKGLLAFLPPFQRHLILYCHCQSLIHLFHLSHCKPMHNHRALPSKLGPLPMPSHCQPLRTLTFLYSPKSSSTLLDQVLVNRCYQFCVLPFLLFDPESPFLKRLSAFDLMHQCICCTSCRAEALSVKGVYVHGFTPILSKVRIKLQLTLSSWYFFLIISCYNARSHCYS